MKILVLCNSASGLFGFREMLLRQLVSLGNSVVAVVPISKEEADKNACIDLAAIPVSLIFCPMDRRGMNPFHDFKLFFTYCRLIKNEKPDLLLTYTIKPNIYGGIAGRLFRVPLAANITGLGTAFQKNGFLRQFVIMLYKLALKKARVVFFENCENRDIILDQEIVRPDQAVLLNGAGVDLEKFSFQPYPIDNDETRFIFIGRIMREKGVNELFAAMRKLVKEGFRCSLDVLGGFDEDYSETIATFESEGWLHYHGYQSDVRPFIQRSHCFVLPSWHEGMANTNLECAASGRPVITSNIHGCMEAVIDGETGFLCERKNPEDLYRVMKHFCELPNEQRKAMGLAGRKRMEEVFEKKKVVEITIAGLEL